MNKVQHAQEENRTIRCREVLESAKGLEGLFGIISRCPWHEEEIEVLEITNGRSLKIEFKPVSRFPFFRVEIDFKGASRKKKARRTPKNEGC